MSGGSFDYLFARIDDYADCLNDKELQDLAHDFAKVFHDAEWLESCDISEDEYRATVKAFKKKWFGTPREERLKGYIQECFERTKQEIADML